MSARFEIVRTDAEQLPCATTGVSDPKAEPRLVCDCVGGPHGGYTCEGCR